MVLPLFQIKLLLSGGVKSCPGEQRCLVIFKQNLRVFKSKDTTRFKIIVIFDSIAEIYTKYLVIIKILI